MKIAPTLITLTLCALTGAAQATDASARAVTFTNGWQPGLSGNGEVSIASSGSQEPNWAFQFSLATQPLENNIGVTFEVTGFTPEARSNEDELLAKLTGAVTEPDFVITGAGHFVGLRDLPGLRKSLRETIRETFGRLNAARSDPGNFERFVEQSTAQDRLEGRAAEDWHRMVSRWIDKRVGVGKEYHFEENVALPIPRHTLPTILMHATYTLTHLQPCDRAAVARTCATLVMHFTPDETDLARLTHEVLGNTPKIGKDPEDVPTMQVEVDAEVVTEVDGLIPHRYAITKKVDILLSKDGKNTQHMFDKRETTFRY
ncbi:MAG: hypothetical protein ACRET4_16300 [Steroidobacteraceae bacterium]